MSLSDIVDRMANSADLLNSAGAIAQEYRTNGKTARCDNLEKQMPCVTFAGTFNPTRAKTNRELHSGLICVDVDDITHAQAVRLIDQLESHPGAVMYLPPFRIGGVKAVLAVTPAPQTTGELLHAFYAAESWFTVTYGVSVDPTCKDPSRLCFVVGTPVVVNGATYPMDYQQHELLPESAKHLQRAKGIRQEQPTPALSSTPAAAALLDADLLFLSQNIGGCEGQGCLGVMIAFTGIPDGEGDTWTSPGGTT